jgi:hypothetical protein
MKMNMNILRISAGNMVDSSTGDKIVYSSVIVLDEDIANEVSNDRIDVGQQHAKVKMSVENDNALARSLANSGLVPGEVVVDVKTSVKAGGMTMEIIGFTPRKAA